jgi:hypothetical protein
MNRSTLLAEASTVVRLDRRELVWPDRSEKGGVKSRSQSNIGRAWASKGPAAGRMAAGFGATSGQVRPVPLGTSDGFSVGSAATHWHTWRFCHWSHWPYRPR